MTSHRPCVPFPAAISPFPPNVCVPENLSPPPSPVADPRFTFPFTVRPLTTVTTALPTARSRSPLRITLFSVPPNVLAISFDPLENCISALTIVPPRSVRLLLSCAESATVKLPLLNVIASALIIE